MKKEKELYVPISHVRQRFQYDCGLACVEMVLRKLERTHCSVTDLQKEVKTHSIWTIDLAGLLQQHQARFVYCTLTLGVDQSFAAQRYYSKDNSFEEDSVRIPRLFEAAKQTGMRVEKRTVSVEELQTHLRRGNVAIVLTNLVYLRRHTKQGIMATMLSGLMQLTCGYCWGSYIGHYIVVVGHSSKGIIYKDPARGPDDCYISEEDFDNARHFHGTDEDIIIVELPQAATQRFM